MRSLILVFTLSTAFVLAQKRNITESDLYSFRWVADPQISPDGSHVAFTYVSVNAKKDGYDTSVWVVSARGEGAPRQITAGPRDGSARWSPDGGRIVFLRSPERGAGQLHVLPMHSGGEARQLTDLPKGANNPVWSPDGRYIAFTSTTNAQDLAAKKGEEEPSDVRIINRATYRFNGASYTDYSRPAHIWTVAAPAVIEKPLNATQITKGRFSEADFVWSQDGSSIYFVSTRELEPYYTDRATTVLSVAAGGGEPHTIANVDGQAGGLSLSADGSKLAFVASLNAKPIRSYDQPDLLMVGLRSGSTVRNLTAKYDFDIGAGLIADQHPPKGSASVKPFWSRDGRYVYVVSIEEGRANLKRVDTETGAVVAVTDANHDVYSLSMAGSQAVMAISTPTRIGDLFALDTQSKKLTQLTDVNAEAFRELNLTEPETIWYKSFNGKRIQAWVQRPPDYDSSKKYPLILNIHGGPHAAYGFTFGHEFQWMAAKGYVVLYPNPRGSTSYGQEFGNSIQYNYPGDDHKDLMAGVDELVRRGVVDPALLGATGGSGGGVLTNWAVTQTDRFKAAVSQRSIADWSNFWYTADFTLFQPTWFRGAPWQEEADFRRRSPLTYVEKIRTPIMFIEGEADLRTPPTAGGETLFRALKYLKRPTVMVQFPGESHELSRSGKPRHRVERLQHIVAWFDKYVMSREVTVYDVN